MQLCGNCNFPILIDIYENDMIEISPDNQRNSIEDSIDFSIPQTTIDSNEAAQIVACRHQFPSLTFSN